MPYIKEIVDHINAAFRTGLTSKPFQKGKFEGIAELLLIVSDDGNKTVPCIVDNHGNSDEVSIDDTYPFRLYHRINTITNEDDGQMGDDIQMKESANMIMIVFGDRRAFNFRPEQLSSMINTYMPLTLTVAQTTSLNLHTVAIQVSTTNLDSVQVFNQEYTGEVRYNLAPQYFLMSIPYVITTTYNKSCFEPCLN